MQALVLALVGIGITVAVYGVVALIVKADDVGVALARNDSASITGRMARAFGRVLVFGMPGFLTFLGAAGTAAMIWVGGAIIVHGLEAYGVHSIGQAMNSAAEAASHLLPSAAGPIKWIIVAFLSGIVGLVIGSALIPIIGFAIAPAWKLLKSVWCKRQKQTVLAPRSNSSKESQ
jgi:predicted DNA repair protein MutK